MLPSLETCLHSPLLILSSIVLKRTGEHLVTYRPLSVRKNYKPFHVLTFVTMGSLFFRDEEEIIEATGKAPKDAYRDDIMPIKGALEVWYREHRSLLLDLKIAFLTAWVILSSRSDHAVAAFRRAPGMPADVLQAYESLIERTIGTKKSRDR